MLIYHISDLHIRAGDYAKSRYFEYMSVFDEFIKVIKNEKNECCVVITGDVFHDKNKIDSPGIKLFYYLIQNIAPIPIYIIKGNHDYRQSCPDEVDIITTLLMPNFEHVHYFDKTCIYET